MTRMERCRKAQPSCVIRRAILGFITISSLGIALGLWRTTGRLFVQADERAAQGRAPVTLRLEVGGIKPLTATADSDKSTGDTPTLVEMSVRTVGETKPNPLSLDGARMARAVSNNDGEVWIEAGQSETEASHNDQPTVVSEPAGEIWLEEDVAVEKTSLPAEVPAPVKTSVSAESKRSGDHA